MRNVLALLMLLLASLTTASAQNDHRHLNAQQRALIRATGIAVIAPRYFPADFAITNVSADNDGKWSHYRIIYSGDHDRCFAIEATSGGIGADENPQWKHYAFHAPLGPGTLYAAREDSAGFTDWFGTPADHGYIQFVGEAPEGSHGAHCTPLPIKEQLKIASSLDHG